MTNAGPARRPMPCGRSPSVEELRTRATRHSPLSGHGATGAVTTSIYGEVVPVAPWATGSRHTHSPSEVALPALPHGQADASSSTETTFPSLGPAHGTATKPAPCEVTHCPMRALGFGGFDF